MEYVVLRLVMSRTNSPTEGQQLGDAQLYFPDKPMPCFATLVEKIKEGGKEDRSWKQRVIAAALNYLKDEGYPFIFMMEDTSSPRAGEEVLLILTSCVTPRDPKPLT